MYEEELEKPSKKEEYKRICIYNEELATVLLEKTCVKLNKPSYIGSSILAISKTLMYDLHYNYMQKTFKDCKRLFTDTDSFCYSITGEVQR